VILRRGLGGFYGVLAEGYRLDALYDRVVIRPLVGAALFLWRVVDERIIDGAVNGLAGGTAGVGRVFRRVQSGIVREYVAAMALGLIVVVAVLWRAL
jgi:NADH-quinone oxidoreductase subunit L